MCVCVCGGRGYASLAYVASLSRAKLLRQLPPRDVSGNAMEEQGVGNWRRMKLRFPEVASAETGEGSDRIACRERRVRFPPGVTEPCEVDVVVVGGGVSPFRIKAIEAPDAAENKGGVGEGFSWFAPKK